MSTGTHLDRILTRTRADLAGRKSAARPAELERLAAAHTPRGFAAALKRAAETRPAVIAELKKASPSKGLIREAFDPAFLAKRLEDGGAACLSVLTDEPFFQGGLRNLEIASATVAIPCLRKDFMVDAFQMVEARAHHADAVLLIVAALTDAELRELRGVARDLQLDVLCEVHDQVELERAMSLDCEMYGINTRNLKTFEVDPAEAMRLACLLPAETVRVAESGLRTAADIAAMSQAGFNAFLIGESLMRAADPGAALRALIS